MKTIHAMFKDLSFADLRDWAGSKIYNRGKEYMAQVSHLSCCEDGMLAAWVTGSDQYATTVRQHETQEFEYICTCPYDGWGPCKHVVALLLVAAERLRQNKEIPLLKSEDSLYEAVCLAGDWLDDEDEDQDPDEKTPTTSPQRFHRLEEFLSTKTRDGLQRLLLDLAEELPELAKRLHDMASLDGGRISELVHSLRLEIRRLAAEEAWYNPWERIGNLPDYSHVQAQLQVLFVKGHADAVLDLGETLWQYGNEQVEQSDDEGETAGAIANCLQVVLHALPHTSLPPVRQLLWSIEHALADEYSLLDGVDAVFQNPHYTREHWREVAEQLQQRLQDLKAPQQHSFSEKYKRQNILDWLCKAYARSGEQHKIIAMLEQEADRCHCYERLVQALLENGQNAQARQWCIRGFQQTRTAAPGLANILQDLLRQLAETEQRYDLAAAYRADDFFDCPSMGTYKALQQAAQQVDVWPAVRQGVLAFLHSGQIPGQDKEAQDWPLPAPEVHKAEPARSKLEKQQFPNQPMLIRIALLEKRNDDAVAFYQQNPQVRFAGIAEELAKKVRSTHPELALQIWQGKAEQLIALVKPKAYQDAAVYLRQMHKVYGEHNRLDDWQALLARLRSQHKAKRRLMEVLDELEHDRKLIR